MGKLHLLVLHFPIALIIAGGLAWIIYLATRRVMFKSASVYCLVIGALGAIASAVTGDMLGDSTSASGAIFETHQLLGVATTVVSCIAAVAGVLMLILKTAKPWIIRSLPYLYAVTAFAAMALVSATGHWGGMMVFGEHYLW